MNRWSDLTLGDVAKGLARYRPFLLLILGIFLISVVLPGARSSDDDSEVGAATGGVEEVAAGGSDAVDTGPAGDSPIAPDGSLGAAGGTDVGLGGTPRGRTGTSGRVQSSPASRLVGGDASAAPDCDTTRGRMKIQTFYAPNCVPLWKGGDNGGATYQGVTKDTVTVAIYIPEEDPQSQAIAAAAGAADPTSAEEDDVNRQKVIEAFEAHFETYGRKVKVVKVEASGPADDDAAAKSDAIKVATEIKAFVSFGDPAETNAYVNELAARGVLCFCTVSQPIENYLKWAPHVWSTLMASSQGYIHRAEYIGKRLAGKPAKWAGDTLYRTQQRKFALVYYETPEGSYKAGADFFEKHIKEKYGVTLTDKIAMVYSLEESQEQSRVIIARLKDKGVTSVAFAGHPFQPIFLTKEATAQQYFPEWIITGSALTDTTLIGRTYDPQQWRNAFGVSFLIARISEDLELQEGNLVTWHHGVTEFTSYPSILSFGTLFTGMTLAGPKLTPQTFRDGLFSWTPTSGYITRYGVAYGRAGQIWPWDDYLTLDDTTEIWWDPTARGQDELGNEGVGMYRYVDMGKRYMPGEWPRTEPKAFDPANTTVFYETRPPKDVLLKYPHQHYRGPLAPK